MKLPTQRKHLQQWRLDCEWGWEVMKHNQIKCNQTFFSSWRFLGLGNLAWVFLVVNSWFRESWVLIFAPINLINPVIWKQSTPLGLQASSQCEWCFIFIFPCLPPPPPKKKELKSLEYEHSISCWHPLRRVHYPSSLGVCR